MTQHPRASLLEAATQATISLPVGFLVSFGVSLLHLAPAIAAALITVAMYVLSILRGYLIRRRFERRRPQ
jgi:hypothetical protein